MFEKGQQVNIEIVDISSEGQGIGRADGLAVFVPGTVVGDKVTAELTKVKKHYAFSSLVSIDKPSEHRIEARCRYAGKCGGCSLELTDYAGQLALKEKQIRDKLVRLGGLEDPKLETIIGMDFDKNEGPGPYHYRNKATFPISTGGVITRKGGIVENLGECAVGFYRGKSHDVIDCQECMIQSKAAMAAADAVRRYMREDNITAWDPKWQRGLMRHLIVKTAIGTGEVMVIMVINGTSVPNAEKLVEYLDDAIYEINDPGSRSGGSVSDEKDTDKAGMSVEYTLESVILNENTKKDSQIMGEKCIPLAGKETILERVGELTFEISPRSFYQVNPVQMKKLYDKAAEYAALTGTETVLDLYCGVGSIGLYMAKDAAQVVGIESVKQAVIDANRNAVINNIVNARFLCGRAEEELPKLLKEGEDEDRLAAYVKATNVVILDPPRAGCRPELLEAVLKLSPERIVYVSCDPATLARDIKILTGSGYKFVKATPVDMFPWTGHVETVVLLTKVQK